MDLNRQKRIKRGIRKNRVRSVVFGFLEKPRLSIFRSSEHIYGQLIDDSSGKTLVSASSMGMKSKGKKTEIAKEVGKLLAKKALEAKFEKIVFDRGGYKYHGRVKAVAEGAREGGLKF